MPYVITETCVDVKDKACVDVCPVDCIHPGDGEEEPMLYIDPDECIDCGACISECPVEAIFADTDVPDNQEGWIERNETECVDAEVAEGDSPILADD